ncbi:T9SS type A sorting domain-containing protein [Flavobacterium sp. 3HN19-14]|uniref:T9SS type A sorting domain-containing protein n=1 Tax=Flavobacterium sp. 3HN19-14 TaxID=3448133 RepID=UPI003EE32BAF
MSGTNLLLGVDKVESVVLGLWPNPASSTLNVTVSDASYNWHVNVVDVQGRILSSQNITSYNVNNKTFSVDVSQLPAGVYMLNMDNGSEKISKKFVRN